MPRPVLQIQRLCALTFCTCALSFCVCALAFGAEAAVATHSGAGVYAGAAPQGHSGRGKAARRSKRRRRAPKRCKSDAAASGDTTGMNADTFDALMRRARAAGAVAVVVRLCVPFRPEGELSDEAARLQRAAIARAQDALLKELRRVRVNSVKRFEYTPFLALTVGAEALLRLRSSPSVAGVTEDAAVQTANE